MVDPREPNLEQRLHRLEEIVTSLERENLALDQALALFEEGVGEVRAAEHLLRHTDLRINRLLEEHDGSAVLEPMQPEPK